MPSPRYLIVTADDFGIGPETSRGVLDLARAGAVTCTVLLVNSPHAESAVRGWRQAGAGLELGWHPCLTLDAPALPPQRVPSLVGPDRTFWKLGTFLRRMCLGRIRAEEVAAEFTAQYARFVELVGRPPTVINSHQHVHLFRPVEDALLAVLARQSPRPFVRRVREPWRTLVRIRGARLKRFALSWLGRRGARKQVARGFPGNDWLIGITDPAWAADPTLLARWLAAAPGRVVELMCHPGHRDETLVGRDCTRADGGQQRRVDEFTHLSAPGFREACRHAGFVLAAPRDLAHRAGGRDAA